MAVLSTSARRSILSSTLVHAFTFICENKGKKLAQSSRCAQREKKKDRRAILPLGLKNGEGLIVPEHGNEEL